VIRRSPFASAVLRRLRGPCAAPPRWREHAAMFQRAYVIVQIFYAVTLFQLYGAARGFAAPALSLEEMDPLWPLWWLHLTGIGPGSAMLAHLALGAGIAGLLAWRYLAVRILVSLALLEVAAYGNSFGAIHHGNHEWFWISVCFWLLPGGSLAALRASRALRMQFLLAIGAATALILLFYSMSGLWKCLSATAALLQGHLGGFSPEAMAVTLANRALQTGSAPLWAGIVIDRPILGWPMYLGLYYVELFAIVIAFRPALIRVWGVILILFHFGTLLFMDIVFPTHVLINAMLFVLSPFAAPEAGWRSMLAALPLMGWLVRALTGWPAVPERVRTPAVADP
jgi:hypothetical protein